MVEVDYSTYDKSKHIVGASRIKFFLWYFTNVLFFINPLNPFSFLKIWLLKAFGAKVGKDVLIKPGVNIKYPWKLTVGDQSMIGERVWIDNVESVIIGRNVCLSQRVIILTGSHDYSKSSFDYSCAPIVLEDGVWIGANSLVAKGVTCYSHSMLSVNSVAERDLKQYTIYKGNPAMAVLKRRIVDTKKDDRT